MTRDKWGAAHVVTLLLLATVGVVGAVAKPAPPLATTNSSYDPHEEEYYYYDYDYDEEEANDLNMSEFRLPEKTGSDAPHVPRYMLELYADQTSHRTQPLPGADLVRSFIASTTADSPVVGRVGKEHGWNPAVRVHTLLFNVTVPRQERVTSATLRLYALITRDQYTYIGVERRVRLVIEEHRGISLDDITPEGSGDEREAA
ncbi:bone morphogenetic protein 10-like isoform X2 [Panulirus ornatus]|uniref:bone morphogenetic protein 10-like isoform X2 n=1 Tax=Panulirus ornatus TaxID=150431 RepID=UPI003A88D005